MESNVILRKKLKRLQSKNRKLKQENIKLKKENKKLIRENRTYKKQLQIKREIRQPQEDKQGTYRYSIAYFSGYMDRTFRGEVYTDGKMDKNKMEIALINGLSRWIGLQNKGLQKNFHQAMYLGIEAEEVGDNDRGRTQLNRAFYFMD